MSSISSDYRKLILSYLASDLKTILASMGEAKAGMRKIEMREKCLEILENGQRRPQLLMKVHEMSMGSNVPLPSRVSQRSRPAADISNVIGSAINAVAARPPAGGTTTSGTAAACLASASLTLAPSGTGASGRDNSARPPPPKRTVNGKVVARARAIHHGLLGQKAVAPPSPSIPSVGIDKGRPFVPEAKMWEYPFIHVTSVLIPPRSLRDVAQNTWKVSEEGSSIKTSTFSVPDTQLRMAKGSGISYVLLRFCDLESASGEWDDQFPPGLSVSVNGIHIPIVPNRLSSQVAPGTKIKIIPKPLDITQFVLPSLQNSISVTWRDNGIGNYTLSVYAGTRLLSKHLLAGLCCNQALPVKFTMDIVRRFTARSEDAQGEVCAPPSIQAYVTCPIGKTRMMNPCRGTQCEHLQCFDAEKFLLMNEKRCKFTCPVCNIRLKYDDLRIDKFFRQILNELAPDAGDKVNVFYDGRWEPVVEVKKKTRNVENGGPPQKRVKAAGEKSGSNEDDDDVVILDPEDDEEKAAPLLLTSGNNNNGKPKEIEVIDLD